MDRPLTPLELAIDKACGFDRANYKPPPEKVPDDKIKLVCPDCDKCCYIPRNPGLWDLDSVLSYKCPDCRKKPKRKRS